MAAKPKAAQRKPAERKRSPRKAKPAEPAPETAPVPAPLEPAREPETSEEAIIRIAQDAVVILRRELEYRAAVSALEPGSVSMGDCISLLRLTTELGSAARRGDAQGEADYSRLSPQERVQLAALLLKVDYA